MMRPLGSLPIGALFIIPGHTDALPTESEGKHYLYRVSSRRVDGKTRVYNKDLRMYSYYSNTKEVEAL